MSDMKEPVRIRYVCVNRLPDCCGECPILNRQNNTCAVIEPYKSRIIGDPNAMTYRRSDCPLLVEAKC